MLTGGDIACALMRTGLCLPAKSDLEALNRCWREPLSADCIAATLGASGGGGSCLGPGANLRELLQDSSQEEDHRDAYG